MKTTKKRQYQLSKILLMLTFVAVASSSLAASVFVRPVAYYCTQTAANKIRLDVYVKNESTDQIGYRSHTLRFLLNRAILPSVSMKGGTVTYVAGTGDPRLNALKATYNNASSFVISASMLQVNLGSGGTVYDQNSSPRVNAGESIWLGTFEIAAPVNWVTGNSANPSWQMRGTSISVYDAPPSTNIATVCSGNPDDADLEFPSAFSAGRSTALKARNAVTTIASRIKAFTSYTCGDNNLRAGIETGSLLNVFPNPTSGKVNISFTAGDQEKYVLRLVDMVGKELITETYTSAKGINQHEIDLGKLSKGMYTLTLEREGTAIQQSRIVVE